MAGTAHWRLVQPIGVQYYDWSQTWVTSKSRAWPPCQQLLADLAAEWSACQAEQMHTWQTWRKWNAAPPPKIASAHAICLYIVTLHRSSLDLVTSCGPKKYRMECINKMWTITLDVLTHPTGCVRIKHIRRDACRLRWYYWPILNAEVRTFSG